jgi:para-nitrobenzyl esterase
VPAANAAASAAIVGYWTRFAKTGDPNGAGAPLWPAHETASKAFLQLGVPIASASSWAGNCEFWDSLLAPPL